MIKTKMILGLFSLALAAVLCIGCAEANAPAESTPQSVQDPTVQTSVEPTVAVTVPPTTEQLTYNNEIDVSQLPDPPAKDTASKEPTKNSPVPTKPTEKTPTTEPTESTKPTESTENTEPVQTKPATDSDGYQSVVVRP